MNRKQKLINEIANLVVYKLLNEAKENIAGVLYDTDAAHAIMEAGPISDLSKIAPHILTHKAHKSNDKNNKMPIVSTNSTGGVYIDGTLIAKNPTDFLVKIGYRARKI